MSGAESVFEFFPTTSARIRAHTRGNLRAPGREVAQMAAGRPKKYTRKKLREEPIDFSAGYAQIEAFAKK